MRVRRVIEYEGSPEWVTETLSRSIRGVCPCGGGNVIREISCEEVFSAQDQPVPAAETVEPTTLERPAGTEQYNPDQDR